MLQVDALKMVGDDTELDLSGSVNLSDQSLALQANGAANLAVLQGFLPDLRSSGRAEVTARITGTATAPVVAGNALLTNGRMRQLSFPHALEEVNGIATFDAGGLRLDGITARLGGGAVRFGGRIGLSGYQLSEFDVTATGQDMTLRYPEGMRSLVDAELALQGPAAAPIVTGTVNVKSANWSRGFGRPRGLFSGLTGGDAAAAGDRRTGRGRVERALRRPADRAVDAAHRQRSGARRRERRSDDARARSIGRCCSAAPRSSAARWSSKAAAIS